MKISFNRRQDGGALVVVLVMCVTIGTVLAGYLGLIGGRYKITLRSQCWNAAIPVLEAGVEEAMAHLHYDSSNFTANGWAAGTVAGLPVYYKQRSFSDGSYYLVNIYNATTNNPYIYSTGFVPAPLDPGKYISRTVKVRGNIQPLLNVAFAAINSVQMNGSGLAADSFNSSNPALSSNGQYDPTKTSTNGNVASVYGPVNFGNHNIAGSLYLGPGVTTYVVTPGQVSGSIYTDFNVSFPDVVLPDTTWQAATGMTVKKTTTYDFTTSGDYYITTSGDIIVEPGVSVRIRMDATSFSPANIHVVSTNGVSGSLTIYQVSGTVDMSGNVTVDSGRARNFYYYGLPGVTSVTYGGTSTFVGVIYAPEADLTLNGGGTAINMVGSSVTKSITMNGHYMFHFDEDLLSSGPTRGFVATSWQEM